VVNLYVLPGLGKDPMTSVLSAMDAALHSKCKKGEGGVGTVESF
jgi:hypothetical protein